MLRPLLYVVPAHLTDSEVQFQAGSPHRDCFLLSKNGETDDRTEVSEWSQKSFTYESVATFEDYNKAMSWTNAYLGGSKAYDVCFLQK